MPSSLHEGLAELFRHRPSLVVDLLAGPLSTPLPDHTQTRLDSGDLTVLVPAEFRADAVVTLTDAGGESVLSVVVEVQLSPDETKRWSWPVYLAALRARRRCPVVLLVVCAKASMARRCAEPIELGHPGWVLRALVLALDHVPVMTDLEQARRTPELVVLSALPHGGKPEHRRILDAVVQAFDTVAFDQATLYSDVVFGALSEAARRYLEDQMDLSTYEPKSEFLRRWRDRGLSEGRAEGLVEGEAKGEAKAVLAFLAARGIDVPEDVRARIAQTTDLGQLDVWIRRAATAGSVDELFD